MYKLCVFAGTTEGRELVSFLTRQPCQVLACVATEYGETLLSPAENLRISAVRLNRGEMEELFRQERFDLVLDATHPYAREVTENICLACAETQTPYLRVLRGDSDRQDGAVYVPDIPGAVDYLRTVSGSILLTTGSKELHKFTTLPDFAERVYARVLPMDASLAACQSAGLKPAHILAMQGPFSTELNAAMLRSIGAAYLVTKDGGTTGGFPEKAEAAAQTGATLVVIGRPPQIEGLTLEQTLTHLENTFGFTPIPKVFVVGLGPGSRDCLTGEAREALRTARCLIGARRMLEAVAMPGQTLVEAIAPERIAQAVWENRACGSIAVVMSGDTGFFSGTKKLLPLLTKAQVRVLPGLSSLSVLCARLGTSYEDAVTVSLHGRERNIAADVRLHGKVFALVGGSDGVHRLCTQLVEGGLGAVRVSVGEKLSYPDERITCGTPAELQTMTFDSLSAVLIENPNPQPTLAHSLPDEAFQRGAGKEGVVPMTKEEIRTLSLSKLRLTEDAVCWDIGAGTGSVSIEMALRCPRGQVYAVERKGEAVALLEENRKAFCVGNLTIVPGLAPEACADLPAPTHVFVGGSSGNLRQILNAALEKNPEVRIVATAIALETVAELTGLMNAFSSAEAVCIRADRSRKAGPYHLMMGGNPVYIFTLQGGAAV